MILLEATPKNFGVKILGDYGDLYSLYDTISCYYSTECNDIEMQQRGRLLTIIGYEIRHALRRNRLCERVEYAPNNIVEYQGCYIDWITLIFTLACLQQNMHCENTNDIDRANFLLLKHKSNILLSSKGIKVNIDKIISKIPANHKLIYFFHQYSLQRFCKVPVEKRIDKINDIIDKMCVSTSPDFIDINIAFSEILINSPEKLNEYELKEESIYPEYDKW